MNWQLVCLAVIAVSMAILTTVQIVVLLKAAKLAQQAAASIEVVGRDLRQLVARANDIADDAARATSLALAQVERVDRTWSAASARVDEVVETLRKSLTEPLKQGAAVAAGVRAALAFLGQVRKSEHMREDDDAMFVG